MHFGFALEFSNVDLLNIDLLDKISPVSILLDPIMPSRRLQDMSSRRLQDVFSATIFRLPRRLQEVLQDVFKTSSRRLQDVFARCLQGVLEDVKLLR